MAFKSVRGEKKDVFREALPRFRREKPKFPQEPACGTLPGLRGARLPALYINPLFFRKDNVEVGDIQFLHVERGLVLEHPLPEQPLHDRRDEKLREPLERRVRVLMRGEAQVLPVQLEDRGDEPVVERRDELGVVQPFGPHQPDDPRRP